MFLITVGLLMTAFMLAVSLRYILNYSDDDLTFSSCLVLGTILACTDPVAVVSLLKVNIMNSIKKYMYI